MAFPKTAGFLATSFALLFSQCLNAQCTCFAQLKYRSVAFAGIPTGRNHSFWWFGLSDGTVWVAEGGPSAPCQPNLTCGLLIDYLVQGNTGALAGDDYHATSSFISNASTQICSQTFNLDHLAYIWNSNNPPTYILGSAPNSNTFAHDLANAGGFTVNPPPNAPGW